MSNASIANDHPGTSLAGGKRPLHRAPSRRRREVSEVSKNYQTLVALKKREEGQTMAEYGVVLAVITIAVFGALTLLSGNIEDAITRVAGFVT